MTSRINIGRPQNSGFSSPTYAPDPNGLGNSRPSAGYRAANPDDPLEKIRAFARNVEENVDIYSQPLKPYLPALGRFLIIITFLEDALRIMTQWSDQTWYLERYVIRGASQRASTKNDLQAPQVPERNLPLVPSHQRFSTCWHGATESHSSHLLQTMLAASAAIMLKKYPEIACGSLLGVVLIQGFGYGLIFDMNFFLRNLSVVGGLFMVFSDSMISRSRGFAGLPSISENDRRK
jgi:hypothetical protein